MKPNKLVPALVGGAAMGVLTGIPFVNYCCCLWIIGGGVLAGFMYSKKLQPDTEFTSGDGVLCGLLAGLIGGFITFVINLIVIAIMTKGEMNMFDYMYYEMDIDPMYDLKDMPVVIQLLLYFMIYMITLPLIGMLGGLLSTVIFKNKKPPIMNQPAA